MITASAGSGTPFVPRPQRTPSALRAALEQVAPHRLGEMERQKDEAITLAARTGSLGPITRFLETWAVTVEIARVPATAARLRTAEHTARTVGHDDPAWREAMDEIRDLHAAALKSLDQEPQAREPLDPEPQALDSQALESHGRAPHRPRSSPFTTFPLAFRGSSPTKVTDLGTL